MTEESASSHPNGAGCGARCIAQVDVPLTSTTRLSSCDVSVPDKLHMVLRSAELQPAMR
jgi:hypothetical protein